MTPWAAGSSEGSPTGGGPERVELRGEVTVPRIDSASITAPTMARAESAVAGVDVGRAPGRASVDSAGTQRANNSRVAGSTDVGIARGSARRAPRRSPR